MQIDSPLNPFRLTRNQFHLAATAWINYRKHQVPDRFYGLEGDEPSYDFVRTSLIRDWLNVLCNEYNVSFDPELKPPEGVNQEEFLDSIAVLMLAPDKNFNKLKKLSERIGSN